MKAGRAPDRLVSYEQYGHRWRAETILAQVENEVDRCILSFSCRLPGFDCFVGW